MVGMRFPLLLPCTLLFLVLAGCTVSPSSNPELVGSWRDYSAPETSRSLELHGDGTWEFGSSSGTWTVQSIDDSDWESWGVDPYGPTRKIGPYGWDGDVADGPIEESNRVDFIWVIYYVDLGAGPRQGQVKFGRWNP